MLQVVGVMQLTGRWVGRGNMESLDGEDGKWHGIPSTARLLPRVSWGLGDLRAAALAEQTRARLPRRDPPGD